MSLGLWRDIERTRAGQRVGGVIVLRFTGPLFFANASALDARIRDLIAGRSDATAIVIDLIATADIDLTAGQVLRQIATDLERDGRRLAVARPSGLLRDELRAYGLSDLMEPTGGTRGSIDDAIIGLGLDPTDVESVGPSGTPEERRVGDGSSDRHAETNRLVLRVLGIGVLVVAGAALASFLLFGGVIGPTTGQSAIPNLVGLPVERARVAALDAGFELGSSTFVRTDDEPEGTVVDQDPPAGTVADAGSEILPVVSTKRQLVLVPDVIGQPEAEAIASLTAAGLTVRRGEPVDAPGVPRGTVVATTPMAATRVAVGSSITYVVSSAVATASPGVPGETGRPGPSGTIPTSTPTSSSSPTIEPDGSDLPSTPP
jgi:anti-anti-sigma regulatory factor